MDKEMKNLIKRMVNELEEVNNNLTTIKDQLNKLEEKQELLGDIEMSTTSIAEISERIEHKLDKWHIKQL